MDIKEIALRLLAEEFPGMHQENQAFMVEFAEALIAELAKQNEPIAFLHEWIEYHPFGDTVAGEPCATITNDEKPFDSSDTVSPLYTFPPTAEQIANETAYAWVSVDDRLPGEQGNDSEEILCFLNGHCNLTDMECRCGGGWGIRLGYYDAEKGMFRVFGRPNQFVTHWMPLPKPPAIDAAMLSQGEQK